MRTSEQVLNHAEIERSGLGQRIQSLHAILSARYPFIGRIALAVYDPGTDLIKTFVSSNDGGPALQRYEATLAQVPSLAALRETRSPRVVDDIEDRYPAASIHTDWLKAKHFRSSYTLPILRGADLSAFLFFDSTMRAAFTPMVRGVLDQFADIITQLYLLNGKTLQQMASAVEADDKTKARIKFAVQQFVDAALRELREETQLQLSEADLAAACRGQAVFDHPDRSQRGRTITHAFHIDLGDAPLPFIEAADDARDARWVPVTELKEWSSRLHDDHFFILDHFLGLLGGEHRA